MECYLSRPYARIYFLITTTRLVTTYLSSQDPSISSHRVLTNIPRLQYDIGAINEFFFPTIKYKNDTSGFFSCCDSGRRKMKRADSQISSVREKILEQYHHHHHDSNKANRYPSLSLSALSLLCVSGKRMTTENLIMFILPCFFNKQNRFQAFMSLQAF